MVHTEGALKCSRRCPQAGAHEKEREGGGKRDDLSTTPLTTLLFIYLPIIRNILQLNPIKV